MTDEDTAGEREGLTARQVRVVVLVGVVVGAVVLPAAGALAMSVLDPGTEISGGVTLRAAEGPAVNLTQDMAINLSEPFPDNETVRVRADAGNATFAGSGQATASVTALTGPWTRLERLDVAGAPLTVNPTDKQRVTVSGDAAYLEIARMDISDDETDFRYGGDSGTTTLTVTGLETDRGVTAIDVATGTALDRAAVNDGTATFELPNSDHSVVLKVEAGSVAPYYENETVGVDSESWVPDPPNASLDTLGELIQRIGPAVIGTGSVDESGSGYVGVLLTGLVMAGAAGVALFGTGAGPVGGVVAALVTGYTLVELGVAPPWIRTLLLFGVGMLVAVAALRIWRS